MTSTSVLQLPLLARSEENKDLSDVTFDVLDFLTDHVETHGLGQGSALANGNNITSAQAESGRAVSGHGLVALLESVVLLDKVEVVTADNNCVLHLGGDDHTPIQSQRPLRQAVRINKRC